MRVPRAALQLARRLRCSSCEQAVRHSSALAGGQTRLWRWGATSGSTMSRSDTIVEVSASPTLVEDAVGVTFAACGASCSAFVRGGRLQTFGGNRYNILGRNSPQDTKGVGAGPAEVSFDGEDNMRHEVISLDFGAYHGAAITAGGYLWTWGWGGSFWYGAGGLGHGDRESCEAPTMVDKFLDLGLPVKQVACGEQHTLVLTTEGRVYTAGKGDLGRLGLGDIQDELDFEEIAYFQQSNDSLLAPEDSVRIVKVGCGNNFSAALSASGELWVWGGNDYGQLGLGEEAMGDTANADLRDQLRSRYPRLIRSLPVEGHRVIDFACGEYHMVVLTASGAIYEWGNRNWLEPKPVSLAARYQEGLKDIRMVAAGEKCSFALTQSGQLYTWGSRDSGCLALGMDAPECVVEPTLVPAEVFNNQKVLDIVASKYRCVAITEDTSFVAS